METNDKLLPTSEALAYLAEVWGFKRSPITFSKWASAGTGPPFRKLGSRFKYYSKVELDEWMRSRLTPRQQSTVSPTGEQSVADEEYGRSEVAACSGLNVSNQPERTSANEDASQQSK
jgi:predicted DNA-binding transcriptional regulator AlpA